MTDDRDIDARRREIDAIDRELLALLNRRAGVALEIGREKSANGQSVWDPSRERKVLDGLTAENSGPLPDRAVRAIFGEVVSACRALQRPVRVCFLGPEATYSHAASLRFFGRSAEQTPVDSIEDVFREVESSRAQYGLIPVENSTEGVVGISLDRLAASSLEVCGEVSVDVRHALMSVSREIASVHRVVSHPQALAQCRSWLAEHLPGRELLPVSSTAAAAAQAVADPQVAAVGAVMLAEKNDLCILAEGIQDRPVNKTRFLAIGSLRPAPTGRDKTSLWFILPHRPGTLNQVVTCLSEAGLNLTRIESRPALHGLWEYMFFVDFEGHRQDEHIRVALDRVASLAERCRVLGSYPAEPQDAPLEKGEE